ncbi:hypothetical protein RB600_008195 [Gaeumannomyces tritici]
MSLNWVMLDRDGGIVPLSKERILYKQQSRISLTLSTPSELKNAPPFCVKSDAGTVYITTFRVIYLPARPTEQFKSFAAPVLDFKDTHSPSGVLDLFSAYSWIGLVQPVPGGNVPSEIPRLEIKLKFNDGGFSAFLQNFNTIKERLQHARDIRAETGQNIPVDEPLPQYEPAGGNASAAGPSTSTTTAAPQPQQQQQQQPLVAQTSEPSHTPQPPPDEAPPGYEEAQAQAIGERMEQTLRDEAERR